MSSKKKTEATKEVGKPALVPTLRFPEFRDDWSESPLGSVIKEYRLNSSVQDEYKVLTSARRGLMRQVDYYGEGRITERDNVGFNVIPADYVTYRSRTDDGRFYFNHNDLGITGIISVYYPVFSSATGSNEFLANLLNHFSILIGSHSVGTSQRVLPISKLLRVTLPIPSPAEQRKIAECLSSVDELMAAQSRKLDSLKTHKKGLMQQIFPREGETQPRLRFPKFQNAGEWEEKALGDVATFYNGRAYKQEELLESGKYTVLRVGNFFTSKNWYYSDLELDDTKYCDDGDLLYAWSASFGPRVWRGEKTIYHYHIWKVLENPGIDRQFLFITLENETEKMKAESANGLGIMHITKGTIEGWKTTFPTKPEQRLIADCLSSLDALIADETQKLEALKTHKKGLMQQLFPSPEMVGA